MNVMAKMNLTQNSRMSLFHFCLVLKCFVEGAGNKVVVSMVIFMLLSCF
jgi:hypothetical protein